MRTTLKRFAREDIVQKALDSVQSNSRVRVVEIDDVSMLRKMWKRESEMLKRYGGKVETLEFRPEGVSNSYKYAAMGTYIRLDPSLITIFRAQCNGNWNRMRVSALVSSGSKIPNRHLVSRIDDSDHEDMDRIIYSW